MFKYKEPLVNVITEVFTSDHFKIEVYYSGRSIIITDSGSTEISISIQHHSPELCVLLIMFKLDYSLKDSNYLPLLMRRLEPLGFIKSIILPSVYTPDLQRKCINNGFKVQQNYRGYIKNVR